MSAVFMEYDGKPVPASDLVWFEIAGCGCCCGVTSVDHRVALLATEEQVWEDFHETKAERDKYRRLGFRFELGLRSDVVNKMTNRDGCPHTPTYGIPPRPKPSGYAWATAHGYGTPGNARLHLFRSEHVDRSRDEEWRDKYPKRTALCGSQTVAPSSQWHHTSGRVECSRCIKKAGGAA